MSRRGALAERSNHWKGGISRTSDGRVVVYCPNHPRAQKCYVLRYRLVMEKIIGRYLMPHEVVHHKNGVCTDDRPENLELMTQSQHLSTHLREQIKKSRGYDPVTHKFCPCCKQIKTRDKFSPHSIAKPNSRASRCKQCINRLRRKERLQ